MARVRLVSDYDIIGMSVNLAFDLYDWIKRRQAKKVLNVVEGTGLKNSLGEYPTLKGVRTLQKGEEYIFHLPAGVSIREFVERKIYFESYLDMGVVFYPGRKSTLIMKVFPSDFPDQIPFDLTEFPDMQAPVPIGVLPTGELLFWDLALFPHMLIGGPPGYGKTTFLIGAAVALKLAGAEIFVADKKRLDFVPFLNFFNVAETEEEILGLLSLLKLENTRRQDILREAGVSKIQDYCGGERLPYMVLLIDELASIETKRIWEEVDSLARLARATGISLLLATQKPSADLWDRSFSRTRDMITGRIAFHCPDYTMSQVILGRGNTAAANLPAVKGRAVAVWGDLEYTVQSLYLDRQKAFEILQEIDAKPYFREIPKIALKELSLKKRGRPKKE